MQQSPCPGERQREGKHDDRHAIQRLLAFAHGQPSCHWRGGMKTPASVKAAATARTTAAKTAASSASKTAAAGAKAAASASAAKTAKTTAAATASKSAAATAK